MQRYVATIARVQDEKRFKRTYIATSLTAATAQATRDVSRMDHDYYVVDVRPN